MDKIPRSWGACISQTVLATATVFLVLLSLSLEHAVVISSIGATAFIVFVMPRSIVARPKNVIGGHLIGLFSGSLCSMIPHPPPSHAVVYSLAVGISILAMVITNTEHPPASGTALGVVMRGFSPRVAAAVLTSSVLLSLAHHLLRPLLRDLVEED